MSNIVPVADIEKMALAVAKSNLFGVKTPEQAMALMLIAQAEGMHPAIAARDYHIIQGRPSLKADAMLARFQSAGGKVEWQEYTDAKVVGVFSHPSGGSISVEWSMDMANKAGLTKNPTWRQYPRQMLRARCISEGIRTVFPGVVSGFYTPEEVQDFAPEEKDVTPSTAPTPAAKPTPMPEAIKASKEKLKAAAKPKPAVIEGTATNISGDANEGNLNDVGAFDKPADDVTKGKIVHAFSQIGFTLPALEKEYAKPMSEWMESDIPYLRQLLKDMKADLAAMQAQQQQPEGEGVL